MSLSIRIKIQRNIHLKSVNGKSLSAPSSIRLITKPSGLVHSALGIFLLDCKALALAWCLNLLHVSAGILNTQRVTSLTIHYGEVVDLQRHIVQKCVKANSSPVPLADSESHPHLDSLASHPNVFGTPQPDCGMKRFIWILRLAIHTSLH